MFSIVQLLKWKQSTLPQKSHSILVDMHQIYIRNMFLFCFGLSMSRQLFGDPIMCHLDGLRIGQSFLDTKCFINGTFTNFSGIPDSIVPILFHDYYQWMPIMFLLLAMSFHFPYRIWSKQVHYFIKELTIDINTPDDCNRITKIIITSKGGYLFWKMFLIECVYLAQVIMQIVLLNYFFNNILFLSGWSKSIIPILFPETALCFYDFFSGGNQTSGKFKCLLPLNAVYRKVFWIVYVVFLILPVLHVFFLLYRLGLAIRWGKDSVNEWWCFQIARNSANTWQTRKSLNDAWEKRIGKSWDIESIYMNNELLTNINKYA